MQGGRLHTLTVGNLLSLTYYYDSVGNITSIEDYFPNLGGTQTQDFTYDAINRLTGATANGVGIPQADGIAGYSYSYDFDEFGRLEEKEGWTLAYTDVLTIGQPHAAITLTNGAQVDFYAYDHNGNMTSRTEDGITYLQAWNAENKLARVTWTEDGRDYATTYVYDGDGNRLLKIEDVELPDGSFHGLRSTLAGATRTG
jgi:YD repeat-containing protein